MKKQYRLVALLLCLCLLLGMFPGSVFAAEPPDSPDVEITLNFFDVVARWDTIKSQFEGASAGQTVLIKVNGQVELPEPLKNTNGAFFYIKGISGDDSISPQIRRGAEEEADKQKFAGTHLLTFENGSSFSELHIKNLTMDGKETTGLVAVKGYREVRLGTDTKDETSVDAVTFQNGYIDTGNGGSVRLEEVQLAVLRNCTFTGNKGNSNLPTTGCLYYSMQGKPGDVKDTEPGMFVDTCQFTGNESHSGAAMYVYGKNAYAYVGPDCTFRSNHAYQRGGAIQCHGTVNVDNSFFTGNESDGLGGTIYVSASRVGSAGKQENY